MTNLGKKIIYQIYPKSFYDSNGDGIGDIRGIIEKIPYIKKLNIDMIWFNPFFVSPQHDNGYDIADYYKIDPRFGTMADFEELVAKLKEINVGVMLDMVFNHCSTDNIWFQKALKGDKKYQKYFYLRPAKKDGSLPTNWQSKFGGSAWAKFGNTDLYYLHLYDPSQADLDWHNPDVRKEAVNVINYWRKKGVSGFRFDVINVTGKSEVLIDSTDPVEEKSLYTDTPVVQKYLKELNENSFGLDPDSVTVGEMSSTSIKNSIAYSNPVNHELSMVFTFHHLKVDYLNGQKWTTTPFSFKDLKAILTYWQENIDQGNGWLALFWNNHDQPWALSRFGNTKKYRIKSSQMLATAMQLMRGTPFVYMGEELGMINADYQKITDYNDIESHNAYHELLDKDITTDRALEIIRQKSRDNSRVPFHWDNSKYAGFSKVKPWLMPTHQDKINAQEELSNGQIFNYYQQLFHLRRNEDLINSGHIKMFLRKDRQVFAYERYLDNDSEKIIVLTNFYEKPAKIEIPDKYLKQNQVLLSNYDQQKLSSTMTLRPYEAIVYKLK